MDCRILRHVTLKANGHLGCDDSIGYGIDLGHVSLAPGWNIRDVLNAPVYRHVRTAFEQGRVPWPGICEGCDLLSAGAAPSDTLATRLELLVEPTLACNLACACCLRKQIIAGGRPTTAMDPAILTRFVTSCAEQKIAIDQVHYIGWGEPLMHGNFRALYDTVKQSAPRALQMVTTAANVDFRTTVGDAALDRLIVSVDGARQQAYQKYRRGGSMDIATKFMRDSKKYGSGNIFLEWKYILFEFNDSDEDILQAQKLADDIGVDSLLFIITNSKWHSERFTVDSPADLPICSPRASISPAAAMNAVDLDCKFIEPPGANLAFIDKCNISVGKFLTVEGWALDLSGAYTTEIELLVNNKPVATTRPSLWREDVIQAYPASEGGKCGYMFRIPAKTALPKSIQIRITGPTGQRTIGGPANWASANPGLKRRKDLPTHAAPPT